MHRRLMLTLLVSVALFDSRVRADDSQPTTDAIRAAVSKSIPLLEKGSAGSAEQRKCFTCHSQAVPVFAFVEAKRRGFDIDEENLQRQLKHTAAHLRRGRKTYVVGKGQGGKILTAGYALLALEAGGKEPDELTAVVAGFMLEYQKKNGHWTHGGQRPPSSGSHFAANYFALRGLAAFGTEEQAQQIEERKKSVLQWLLDTAARDNEDRVFRLRALQRAGADDKAIQQAVKELVDQQGDDGGWTQTAKMTKSDAYATATAVVALLSEAGLPADHPTVRRAVKYLLDAQQEDGSWHVVTRAKGFQPYFESGFPHGKDQFISTSASGWATLALLLALPE